MECDIWLQAVLPTSKGGLGIRRSSEIALPAFLAEMLEPLRLVAALVVWRAVLTVSDLGLVVVVDRRVILLVVRLRLDLRVRHDPRIGLIPEINGRRRDLALSDQVRERRVLADKREDLLPVVESRRVIPMPGNRALGLREGQTFRPRPLPLLTKPPGLALVTG